MIKTNEVWQINTDNDAVYTMHKQYEVKLV